ncbi:MAG TPA: SRPBCC family protein [Solirubrobacterales bacterium]|nr:SRPBCC family protein [Solirubrobacterales bacterium]
MATLHFKATTKATPEQFVAALTDFGPGRAELFPNSTDDELTVHGQGPTEADVTEGSKGIWERLHYDWSDPNRVVLTTTDSNTWSNKSGHTYAFKRQPDGMTGVEYTVVRDGKTLKGHLLGLVVGTVGRGVLKKAFDHAVEAIEARRGGDASPAGAS